MKNLPRIFKYFLVFGIVLCAVAIFSCANGLHKRDTKSNVTIEEARIFIPGTEISEKDQKALNEILSQYRTSLYKIQKFENGKLAETRGSLKDKFIGGATISRVVENAGLTHLTGLATQVGFQVGTRHTTPTPPPGANIGTHHRVGTEVPGTGIGSRHVSPTPLPSASVGIRHTEYAGSTIGVHHVGAPTDRDYEEAEALVKRLRPILQKYSKE
jgi:hypothetical protein